MTILAYRLMLMMVFTMPWEDVVSVPGAGSVSRLIGLMAGLVWVLSVVSSGRVREPRMPHLFAVLFVLWNACTLMWTVDGPATQERVFTYAQDLVLMMIVWDTVTTLQRVRQTLLAYLAGCYVTAVSLVVGYLTAGAEYNGRATLGDFNPNDVSMLLALGLPIAAYVVMSPGSGIWRAVHLAMGLLYIPLSGYAILMTGSRAALAALLPGLAYLGYRVARRRPVLAVGSLASLVVLAVLALPLAPPRVRLHLTGTGSEIASGDLNERGGIWAEAIRLFYDNPLLGTGAAAFREAAVGANKVGHNFALSLLAEVGLVGFGLFMALLLTALLSLRRVRPLLRQMWWALFSAWLVAALLHNWEYRKQTWLFLALVIACGAVGDRHQAGASGPQERSEAGQGR
jgi:O-antigen ligase